MARSAAMESRSSFTGSLLPHLKSETGFSVQGHFRARASSRIAFFMGSLSFRACFVRGAIRSSRLLATIMLTRYRYRFGSRVVDEELQYDPAKWLIRRARQEEIVQAKENDFIAAIAIALLQQ